MLGNLIHFDGPCMQFLSVRSGLCRRLQLPPRDGHPCLKLTLPTANCARDFHPIVMTHAGRTQNECLQNQCLQAFQAFDSIFCDPDWIRTNDRQLRRLMLYPTELPGQKLDAKLIKFLQLTSYSFIGIGAGAFPSVNGSMGMRSWT